MSKVKEFFCLSNDNNGFKVGVFDNPDADGLRAELTRIENCLPQQSDDSDPLQFMKYHDPEEISALDLDQVVEQTKARIQELGFQILHWKEEAI